MEPLDHFLPSNTKSLVDEAVRAFKAGRFEDSYATCGKVIGAGEFTGLAPDDVDALVLKAIIAAALDKPDDVLQHAYTAFLCRPKYPDRHDQFGGSHKAIAELIRRTYETALADQQFPSDSPWRCLVYGIACHTLGEFDKARAAYNQSMSEPSYKFYAMCYLNAMERAEDDRRNREQIFNFENHIFSRKVSQQESGDKLHDLHVQLYDNVRRAPSLRQEIHAEAPYAKWVTSDLANVPNKRFQELKTKIAAEVDGIIASLTPEPGHPFLGCIPESYKLEIFGALLGPGGYHSPHIHSGAWLSGGYYVQMPDLGDREEDDYAACIEFGRCFLGDPDNFGADVKFIQPQEGMLLMWPGYYMHNTVPCQSQRERLTIGINVYPVE